MAFRVGQKVVCISPKGGEMPPGTIEPDKNDIGTVTNVYWTDDIEFGYVEVIELLEFPSPGCPPWKAGWLARYFRPIVESNTETGMAILREILERESYQDRVPEKQR